MEKLEKKITILPHTPSEFIIPWNGKFDMERAIMYGGIMAGECYEPDGYEKLRNENPTNSRNRGNRTADSEHYTTHEHIHIGLEIANYSKLLAMTLNNERPYVTSEKSSRYTEIDTEIDPNISELEAIKYKKWVEIFKTEIEKTYPGLFNEKDLQKKAQENARYMVTSFASTKFNHTLDLVQLNRIACWMTDFCNNVWKNISATEFDTKLAKEYEIFVNELKNLGLLDERLQSNNKNRKLSLFTNRQVRNHFDDSFAISYKGSIAMYAQSHRHRTEKHRMIFDPFNHEFYNPEIIKNNDRLSYEYYKDINEVMYACPQGKLVTFNISGSIEDFIAKGFERRCSCAQLEIDKQEALSYAMAAEEMEKNNHPDAPIVRKLALGPRCTAGYPCKNKNCKFPGFEDNGRLI